MLISSVIELASPQLNFMLLFWISSVKLLLWYFFCISSPFHLYPSKCILTWFWDVHLQMASKAWFTVHCKFCSSKVSKTAILRLVIFFTNLKRLLRYSRGSNCVLHFNTAPSMAVILPVSYRYHLLSLFHPKFSLLKGWQLSWWMLASDTVGIAYLILSNS